MGSFNSLSFNLSTWINMTKLISSVYMQMSAFKHVCKNLTDYQIIVFISK